jgi:hypothetical protein
VSRTLRISHSRRSPEIKTMKRKLTIIGSVAAVGCICLLAGFRLGYRTGHQDAYDTGVRVGIANAFQRPVTTDEFLKNQPVQLLDEFTFKFGAMMGALVERKHPDYITNGWELAEGAWMAWESHRIKSALEQSR